MLRRRAKINKAALLRVSPPLWRRLSLSHLCACETLACVAFAPARTLVYEERLCIEEAKTGEQALPLRDARCAI